MLKVKAKLPEDTRSDHAKEEVVVASLPTWQRRGQRHVHVGQAEVQAVSAYGCPSVSTRACSEAFG